MRGGAQSHLLQAEDGHYYVVKFINNPQHRRTLVNEVVAYNLLRCLGLTVPEYELISVTEGFLVVNPEVHITMGTRRVPVQPGLHFGSRYPGAPECVGVYDFVSDDFLPKVANLREFLGVFIFDKWMANEDGRQCIFHRALVQEPSGLTPSKVAWVVQMIDHGFVFGAEHWRFLDTPRGCVYPRLCVYNKVRSIDDFQPWLDRVCHLSADVLKYAFGHVPAEWIRGEQHQLKGLIKKLLARRSRVPDLIEDARRCDLKPFLNWQ